MRESFEEYVASSSSRLLRFAYVLCGDRHLAEDLVQDVLARAYRRWNRIEADQPDGYLRAAIVRAHLSLRRRKASTEKVTADVPEPVKPVSDFTHRLAVRDELWAMLAGLSRTQRAVVVLRFYEDLDDNRIAEVLGCSPITVRVHAMRALDRLRTNLSQSSTQPQGERR
jgi:RNA polymerase sigma-70 factor (sigma-E family)